MVRNLGGAIGIAVASQIVVERGKLHAMRLGESIVPYSDACEERLIGIVRTISGVYVDRKHALLESGLTNTRQVALALVDRLVEREATLTAYSDASLIAGIAMAACAVAALALRRSGA
jgi:DHA2 family multidrug resistance protein